jgi:hypothetical protein
MLSTDYIIDNGINLGTERTSEEKAKEEGGWYYDKKNWLA